MEKLKIGFAVTGSFCTFRKAFEAARRLVEAGHTLTPIMSFHAAQTDTRFGKADENVKELETICGREVAVSLPAVEPIGPKGLLDVLLVAPCTGNTLAKIAAGIADTPVTLAVKSQLRNGRPVVIAPSTNDALSAAAKNIGQLMSRAHIFFVPFAQDAPEQKPASAVALFELIVPAVEAAARGEQLQPVIREK